MSIMRTLVAASHPCAERPSALQVCVASSLRLPSTSVMVSERRSRLRRKGPLAKRTVTLLSLRLRVAMSGKPSPSRSPVDQIRFNFEGPVNL